MSDEEVDELLKAVDTSSGEINYTGMSPYSLPAWSGEKGMYGMDERLIWIRTRPHDSRKLDNDHAALVGKREHTSL